MDVATASALIAAVYPPLKDLIVLIFEQKDGLSGSTEFKGQFKEMVTIVQKDIKALKDEITDVRELCANLNIPLDARGEMPWKTPRGANGIAKWKYKRAVKKINNLSDQFSDSVYGIMGLIDCITGVSKGITQISQDGETPDWARDLHRNYEDIAEKVASPDKYSINEFTNEIEIFLDRSKTVLQKIASFL